MIASKATRLAEPGSRYNRACFSNSAVITSKNSTYDNKIDTLLTRLGKVKSTGNGKWLACCPAHPDKSPSLGIKQTDDGKILIHCFGGCQVVEIVSAIGLQLSDLMPYNPTYQKGAKQPHFNKYELFDVLAREALILSLALRQLLNFEDLSQEDLLRVVKAEDTINRIVSEVRS